MSQVPTVQIHLLDYQSLYSDFVQSSCPVPRSPGCTRDWPGEDMNRHFQYDTFEDWFEEQQYFSLRSEYLWSELGEENDECF